MAHITSSSRGVFVIAVTPFLETGALDHDSIDRMVDFYAEKGADGLTILGMMGEAPKLTQAESIEVTTVPGVVSTSHTSRTMRGSLTLVDHLEYCCA